MSFGNQPGICFVGYLIESKRISLFLKSLSHTESDIRSISIAGDGALKPEVETAAAANPIISYRGLVPNEEVREMMRDNSLLVVPSLSESFGLVYIEALFEGMAVLGYAPVINEFREVMNLTEEEKKLVVPVEPLEMSPEDLALKIDAAFEFRQSTEGKKAMKRVQKKAIRHFEWDSVINKMTDFYSRVIDI
jgi:glycosyltransferase involved in cell wall biosynthesis